ncbi:MAG: hypothetical protein DRP74_06580 [Candidatus Omnitrophota bacterium]|nr:MAG: hypothetical protein DRP74_06580 [Candidatus Omnitrophota bacterium]
MRILALDAASEYTGWCFLVDNKLINMGVLDCHRIPRPFRMVHLGHNIIKLIQRFDPEYLCTEGIYQRYFKAFVSLARIQGMIMWIWWTLKLDLPIIIPCVEARKELGIPGNAKKVVVLKQVNKLYRLKLKDDNIADAVVLAKVCYQRLKRGERKCY